ncbi:MAG: FeoB-associated Cys-rich membrane protein [Treponema sp.]|nr:FeoB-associated Cys-rich membrane protein [Treponema sp.]
MGTVLVSFILLAIVSFIIFNMIKEKKLAAKNGGCGGGCSGCSGCGGSCIGSRISSTTTHSCHASK